MSMTNICDVCGRPFRPKRADAKTCSAACRKALSRSIEKGNVDSPPRRARVQPEQSGLPALASYVAPPVTHQAVNVTSMPGKAEAVSVTTDSPQRPTFNRNVTPHDGDEIDPPFREWVKGITNSLPFTVINTTPHKDKGRVMYEAGMHYSWLKVCGHITQGEILVMDVMPELTRSRRDDGMWHIARVTLDGVPVVHATYLAGAAPTSARPAPVAPVDDAAVATNTPPAAPAPAPVVPVDEPVEPVLPPLIVPDDGEVYNTVAPVAPIVVDADAALASILGMTQTFHWSGMVEPVTLDIPDGYRLMPPAAPEGRIDPIRPEGRRMVANPVKSRYWETGNLHLYLMDDIAGMVVDVAKPSGHHEADALRREEYAQMAYDLGLWQGGYLIMDSDALWDTWQPNSGWKLEVKQDADAPDKCGRVWLCATVPDKPTSPPEPPEPPNNAPGGGAAKCDTDSLDKLDNKCDTTTTSGGTGKGKKPARGVQVRPFAEANTWQGHYLNLHGVRLASATAHSNRAAMLARYAPATPITTTQPTTSARPRAGKA